MTRSGLPTRSSTTRCRCPRILTMIEEVEDPIVRCAERLCVTLDRIGDALVGLDADSLLETEATLRQLLAALASGRPVKDKASLVVLVECAADALQRCRRLGTSFSAVAGA